MMTRKTVARMSVARVALAVATSTGVVAVSAPARADHLIYSAGDFSLSWDGTSGAGVFAVPNANFGGGMTTDGGSQKSNAIWAEGWLKPEFKASYHTQGFGTLYGTLSGIGGQTIGDGDPTGSTSGNPGAVALEEAYVGWSGDLPTQAGDSFSLQLGRQSFSVDDGFLIGDGTLDTGSRSNFYMAPRTAFDGYGVLKLNSNPVRADFFALRTTSSKHITTDQPRTNIAGFDAQWFKDASGAGADGSVNYADRDKYVGVTAFQVYDTGETDAGGLNRDGMTVLSGSFGGHLVPINALGLASNFTLYGQYVWEFRKAGISDHGTTYPKMNASSYYIEPGYTFDKLPLAPKVFYRYLHFSGTDPAQAAAGGTNNSYDPFFYTTGIRGSFGTYFLGEIVGVYNLFNTNENVHQFGVSFNPSYHVFDHGDSSTIDLYLYHFDLDHPAVVGGSKNYADEADVIYEYSYNAATYVALGAGLALPHSAAKDVYNSLNGTSLTSLNKPTELLEAYVDYSF